MPDDINQSIHKVMMKTSLKFTLLVSVISILIAPTDLLSKPERRKSVVEGSIEGAIVGSVLGNIFGDKEDGKKIAKIGAAIGALKAAEKNRKQREAEERAYQEELLRLERERIQLERELRIQREQRLSATSSSQLVKKVQRSLIVLGFAEPPVSGVLDPDLRNAIRIYQRVHKLTVDGLASQALLQHLQDNGG